MANHGSFNKYLHRFKIKHTETCDSCGAENDDALHAVFECEHWMEERRILNDKLGVTLTPENMVNIMLNSSYEWKLCEDFINKIMKQRCTMTIPNLFNSNS